MNAIVAVDNHWGIGYKNDLLFHVPEDMRYFKEKTTGKIVIMGKNTFYSLPHQKPLKDRTNIVLSRNKDLQIDGVTVCHSLEQLRELLKEFKTDAVFIIGGQAIYELLLPYCKVVYVTHFNAKTKADKHFPNLSVLKEWRLAERSEPVESKGLTFTFDKYVRL